MKLDINCVRDVMLTLEDDLVIDENGETVAYSADQLVKRLSQYGRGEIIYTVKKLIEGGLLTANEDYTDPENIWFFRDSGITYKGHDFIASVRPQPVWMKVRSRLENTGGRATGCLLMSLAEEALKGLLF